MKSATWILLLLVPLCLPASGHSAPCDIEGTILVPTAFDPSCPEIHVVGETVVAESGGLFIQDVPVVVEDQHRITVHGRLVLDNVSVTTMQEGGTTWDDGQAYYGYLVLETTALVALADSSFSGGLGLVVKTEEAAVFDNVTISQPATAIEVLAGRLEAHRLRVMGGTTGVLAVGDADVFLASTSFAGTLVATDLRSDGDAGPTLRLLDTAIQSRLQMPPGSRVEWLARTHVQVTGGDDVEVTSWDRDGNQSAEWVAVEDGFEALLPYKVHEPGLAYSPNPYLVAARSGASAAHAVVDAPTEAFTIQLPATSDVDPPSWPAGALQATPVHGGSFTLTWTAADDTVGGGHPGRAVSRYEVLQDGKAGNLTLTAEGRRVDATRVATTVAVAAADKGDHTFIVRAFDLAGNHADSNAVPIDLDPLALSWTLLGEDEVEGGLQAGPTRLQVVAEPASVVCLRVNGGVARRYVEPVSFGLQQSTPSAGTVDQGCGPEPSVAASHPADGEYFVQIQATRDSRVAHATLSFTLDTQPPRVSANLTPELPPGVWSSTPFNLSATATDQASGVKALSYRIDGSVSWVPVTAPTVPLTLAKGHHSIEVRATDRAGHTTTTTLVAAYDPDAPRVRFTVPPPTGTNGWHVEPARLGVVVEGGPSGRLATFRIDQGPWLQLADAVRVSTSGVHTVQVRASNPAGVVVGNQTVVKLDLEDPVPPRPTWASLDGRLRADWADSPAFDASSGVQRLVVETLVDGQATEFLTLPLNATSFEVEGLAAGDREFRLRVTDMAGREAASPWQSKPIPLTAEVPAKRTASGPHLLSPASASGVREVRFYVDGQLAASDAQPPFEFLWETRSLSDGVHKVAIVTVDSEGGLRQEVTAFELRNAYPAVVADNRVAFCAALACLALAIALASASLRSTGPGRRRVPRGLAWPALALAVLVLACSLVAPKLLWGPALSLAWWAAAATALVIAAIVAAVAYVRRPAPEEETAQPAAGKPIDFDRPWRGTR